MWDCLPRGVWRATPVVGYGRKRCVTSAFRSATEGSLRRRSQVVRQRFAKPPFVSSILTGASRKNKGKRSPETNRENCGVTVGVTIRKRPKVSPEPLRCRGYGCTSNAPTSHIVATLLEVSYTFGQGVGVHNAWMLVTHLARTGMSMPMTVGFSTTRRHVFTPSTPCGLTTS